MIELRTCRRLMCGHWGLRAWQRAVDEVEVEGRTQSRHRPRKEVDRQEGETVAEEEASLRKVVKDCCNMFRKRACLGAAYGAYCEPARCRCRR